MAGRARAHRGVLVCLTAVAVLISACGTDSAGPPSGPRARPGRPRPPPAAPGTSQARARTPIVEGLPQIDLGPNFIETRPPSGLTGYGLQLGVTRREWAPFTDRQRIQNEAKRALPEFPDAVLALVPQVPTIFRDCEIWDLPPADPSVRAQTRSDVPALLLEGSLDAVAPSNWAEAAASGLRNSRVLVFPGAAHDVLIWSQDCAVTIMRNFLNQPGGGYDDSCLRSVVVPPFKTS